VIRYCGTTIAAIANRVSTNSSATRTLVSVLSPENGPVDPDFSILRFFTAGQFYML